MSIPETSTGRYKRLKGEYEQAQSTAYDPYRSNKEYCAARDRMESIQAELNSEPAYMVAALDYVRAGGKTATIGTGTVAALLEHIERLEQQQQQQRDKDMQEAVRNARAAVRHQQEAYGYV